MPSSAALAPKTAAEKTKAVRAADVKSFEHPSIAAQALPWFLQAKLTVGAADDPLELEADRVADRVMRMPDACCASCAGGSPCEGEKLQRKPDPRARSEPAPLHGTLGKPLDAASLAFFEPRFRQDFSRVRIHTSAKAAESTVAVGALAYTTGEHIVFGAGQYAPHTNVGRRLLAHELTHVAQHRPGVVARQTGTPTTTPSPQETIGNANTRRIGTLLYAISELANVISAVQAGLGPNPYTFTSPAIQRWLHVNPDDSGFLAAVQAAESLFLRNLQLTPTMLYQSNTVQVDPAGNACPPNFAYSRGGVGPIFFCDNFLAKGPNCQRDVMIHEHFHLLGLALPPSPENYGAPTTALALRSPDSLAQLAAEIADGPHTASCLGSD